MKLETRAAVDEIGKHTGCKRVHAMTQQGQPYITHVNTDPGTARVKVQNSRRVEKGEAQCTTYDAEDTREAMSVFIGERR